jgi:hypothetical protein
MSMGMCNFFVHIDYMGMGMVLLYPSHTLAIAISPQNKMKILRFGPMIASSRSVDVARPPMTQPCFYFVLMRHHMYDFISYSY